MKDSNSISISHVSKLIHTFYCLHTQSDGCLHDKSDSYLSVGRPIQLGKNYRSAI